MDHVGTLPSGPIASPERHSPMAGPNLGCVSGGPKDMQTLGPRPVPEESDTHLPLAFPMARWLSFDLEERSRFNRAQLVLDAMEATAPNSVGALARDTGLEHQDLGEALAL